MKTTAIIVELVVIGMGTTIASIVFTFGWQGIPLEKMVDFLDPALITLVLFISYVVGIVIDRLSDRIFDRWENRLRTYHFPDHTDYQHARSLIFSNSEHVQEWVTYGRVRLRVARGWSLNCILIMFSVFYAISSKPVDWKLTDAFTVSIFFLGLLFIGCTYAWYELVRGELKLIQTEYMRLKKIDSEKDKKDEKK